MKEKNKKKLSFMGLFLLIGMFLISSVSADTSSCDLDINLVNQDPYPAIPGDYVDVVFQISGVQNSDCEGAWFELSPSYPFSLDENDTLRTLEGSTWILNYKNEWMVAYKLRVDKDAFDGTSEIEIHYAPGTWNSGTHITERFNISIEDSRTDFDVVIQEISDSEVSIAIANTGKYAANSVVVRIPEQEGFKATGTNGQMVGNLDAGDYSIVGFSLTPLTQGDPQKKKLQYEVHYTDSNGERRIDTRETPLKMSSEGSDISDSKKGMKSQEETSGINWALWGIFGIIIVVGSVVYGIYLKTKNKSNNSSKVVPNWMKNAKDKK